MSAPHPLNQAVIAQALHDLRNGQLRRCKAMGFGEEELDALKHPELVSMLVNATVSWCSVSVNRDVLKRLLSQVHDVKREIATVDRMLRLGASTEMVSRFYGLTHQEVALRRDILGLPKRKGRHPVLDEEQDTALWRHWQAGIAEAFPPALPAAGRTMDEDNAHLRLAIHLGVVDPAAIHFVAELPGMREQGYGGVDGTQDQLCRGVAVTQLAVDPGSGRIDRSGLGSVIVICPRSTVAGDSSQRTSITRYWGNVRSSSPSNGRYTPMSARDAA